VALLVDSFRTLKPQSISAVVIALAGAIALLYYGQLFFVTLITAVIIAFILEPFVILLMRARLPRALASFIVCVCAVLVLYVTGLGLYTQIAGLSADLPAYSERIAALVGSVTVNFEETERAAYLLLVPKRTQDQQKAQQPPPAGRAGQRKKQAEAPAAIFPPPVQEVRILQEGTPLMNFIYAHLGSVYEILLMSSFVPFLVYFMLSWRDHVYRAFLQLFEGQARQVAGNSMDGIASMVRGFVVGNFTLGLMLAFESSLLFWIFRLPYPLLAGPISGFVSLIPYIGLPLAVIPAFLTALPVYSTLPPYLLIGSGCAAPAGVEPSLPQDCRLPRPFESPGGHHCLDAVGHHLGRSGTDSRHSVDGGDQGGLR
jgi:predicted PurR-regulated permease PerM